MLSMFRLVRNLSDRTWNHRSGYVCALSMFVPKQAITAGCSKTTEITPSKRRSSGQSNETNISASAENKELVVCSPPRNIKSFRWTNEKDAVLQEGIARYRKDGWTKVAEFMGGGVKDHQCFHRAAFLEGLARVDVKRGAWDQDELRRLEELVPQYSVHSYWSTQYKKMTDEYTDWTGVGKEMGRLPHHCKSKWNKLKCEKLKKGRFTAEEDALIMQRVAEWGDKEPGLWTALQKEMGRASDAIQKRWNALVSAFQLADVIVCWSTMMDERLTEGVAKHKAEGWAKVAKYVGGGVTADKCNSRWSGYLEAMQHGNVKRGAWDQDEEERLAELVPQYLVPSHLSEHTGGMTREYTDWVKIAAKLGRLSIDCKHKWTAMRHATMKKGPFTDSENAIIRERVEGWDPNKTKGLWVGLQKDLVRPATRIRTHWVDVLSKE